MATFETALDINPDDIYTLNYLGYILADRCLRLDEAKDMIEKALSQSPENGAFLDSLGWVYYRLGDFKKARFYVEKALKFEEKSATMHDHLGDIYYELGKHKRAILYWERALEMKDVNPKESQEIYQKLQNVR